MNKIAIEDIDLLAIPSDFNPFGKYEDGGEMQEEKFRADIEETKSNCERMIKDVQEKLDLNDILLQKAVEDKKSCELELLREKLNLQQTADRLLNYMESNKDDMINRPILANLLVSYFKKNRFVLRYYHTPFYTIEYFVLLLD